MYILKQEKHDGNVQSQINKKNKGIRRKTGEKNGREMCTIMKTKNTEDRRAWKCVLLQQNKGKTERGTTVTKTLKTVRKTRVNAPL